MEEGDTMKIEPTNDSVEGSTKPEAATASVAAASSKEKSAEHMEIGDLVRITDRYVV